jgi:hypothetical protein
MTPLKINGNPLTRRPPARHNQESFRRNEKAIMDICQWEFAYVWHGAVVPLDEEAEFLDRQGRVHARVSVDFVKEFGCYLAAPMRGPWGRRA